MPEKIIEISLPLDLDSYVLLKEYMNKKNVIIDRDIIDAFFDYDAKLNCNYNMDEIRDFTYDQIMQIPRLAFMMIETLILLDNSHNQKTLTKRKEFAIQCFTELAAVENYNDYHPACEGGINEYLMAYPQQSRAAIKHYIDAVHSPSVKLEKLKQNENTIHKIVKVPVNELLKPKGVK
jgi:hypothetical protein